MTDLPQSMNDQGDGRKYFHMLENMADDDLDPFAYRLLGHYKRVCGANGGVCTESVRTTAEKCKMAVGMVSRKRKELRDLGWLTYTVRSHLSDNGKPVIDGIIVTLKDRWAENVARYSRNEQGCSCSEQVQGETCSYHEQGCSLHETKKNQKQKNKKDITANAVDAKSDKPKTEHQLMFQAVCDALGLDADYLTKKRKGTIGLAASAIRGAQGKPEHVAGFMQWLKAKARSEKWSAAVSEHAMNKYWGDYATGVLFKPEPAPQPDPFTPEQLAAMATAQMMPFGKDGEE